MEHLYVMMISEGVSEVYKGSVIRSYTNYPKEMSGHSLDKIGPIMQKLHITGTNHW